MTPLHPALPLFAAAVLQPLVPKAWRGAVALGGAAAAVVTLALLPPDASVQATLLGFELRLLSADALARVFGLVYVIMAGLGTLYALHVRRAGEQAATLVYAGSALGVVFAGDWLTLYLFWELMAVASTAVVWFGGSARSRAAGFRYVFVHLVSGSFLLAGILLLRMAGVQEVGPPGEGVGSWLVLAGVAINAAVPPVHAWLTDAYPEASVTGAVFLSAFTTKTAVYVLVRVFPGAEPLAWLGVAMALYGVVFAVLENDIRRLLAYHIVSQVGYMVAGVGMGTPLALNGAAAHAFCHILYKALLFMGAGAVIEATGRRKLTELGGLAPRMKAVVALYMVGAFSISGVPLFNGFVSKSMVVSAAAEGGWPVLELLLTLASVGTFLHTGLKLPYFTFFGSSSGGPVEVRPVPRNMLLAMAAAAVLCTALGIAPGWLYARLPFAAGYEPYTADHVLSAVQLLLGTGLGFWLLLKKLAGEPTVTVDTDWLYRGPLRQAMGGAVYLAAAGGRGLAAAGRAAVALLAQGARNPMRLLPGHARRAGGGPAARPLPPYDPDVERLPIGVTVFWIVAALGLTAVLIG